MTRPDNRADHAKLIASNALRAIKLLDEAKSRREVSAIHADWSGWADRNRVCRQIREHLNQKAAERRSQFAEPPPRDHKLAAAADR